MKCINDLDNLKENEIIKGNLDSKEWNLMFKEKDTTRSNTNYIFYGISENKKLIEYHCFKNNINVLNGKIVQEDLRYGDDFCFISEETKRYKEVEKLFMEAIN